ncbi:hypothetical protein SLNSH_23205 [Alsobacter soli]|uniref:Glycosyl transferase family 1 domain-containing protein n=1 Tax=Alsobacter soli TaxID=2109933 RepID=A0A2T1HLT6_9HYPH|nr:hypothetical protein SLNSH_23205 [Alsobacter soli]
MRAWIADAPAGLRVEPVRADADGFALARAWTARQLGLPRTPAPDAPALPRAGDTYFMPDLDHAGVVAKRDLYRAMRRDGVRVAFMVHDLLPVTRPEFFPPHAARSHAEWLAVVAEADIAACPTQAVAEDLKAWVRAHGPERAESLHIVASHHGADLRAAPAARGLDRESLRLLARLSGARAFLMVGTVEPRKGHADAVDAFERLWAAGGSEILVIAGRPGWMVESLVARLRGHPERNRRLFYVETATDDLVDQLYVTCGCLIMASHAEGFGLPLVEAAARGCSVIARDIPVFREVAGERACYFEGGGDALAQAVDRWRRLDRRGEAPRPRRSGILTWAQSARNLGRLLTEER